MLAKSEIMREMPDSAREGRFCAKLCARRIAEFQEPCLYGGGVAQNSRYIPSFDASDIA